MNQLLDTIFNPITLDTEFTFTKEGLLPYCIMFFAALAMGLVFSLIYLFTHRNKGYMPGYPFTILLMPPILATILLLANNTLTMVGSVSALGIFSLLRYRTYPSDPHDITYVLISLAAGILCGMGCIGYAVLFSLFVIILLLVIHFTGFGQPKSTSMSLKITIPEDLNFYHLFDETLDKYTRSWELKKIRTVDFGSLYEITYIIALPNAADQKAFLDDLRCLNGNLSIQLNLREFADN